MKGLKRMKIKTKIWVLFLACILMSSVISIGTVVYSSQKSNLKHIGEMTTQTLHAIDSNLELMIDHVNQDTYAVFWSKMFQDTLEEVSKGNLTVKTRTELQDCLTNIMLAGDYISSIVFYDNIGNSFMCNREEVVLKKEIAVEDAYWYEKAIKKDGDWIFETDGGGIVSYKSKNRNILSMIRVIKKKTDYSKLGILMVNIDEKTIREIFDSVGGNLNSNFYVLMNDILIFGPKEKENYDVSKDIIGSLEENETKIVRSEENSMVYKKISSMIDGWTLAIETPMSSFSNSISYFNTLIVLIVNIFPPRTGKIVGGSIEFEGKDVLALSKKELNDFRGKDIAVIFQDPMTSLDPVFKIGKQMTEMIMAHQNVTKDEAWKMAVEALSKVGIPEPEKRMNSYPYELSGGMCQRVIIAMAV